MLCSKIFLEHNVRTFLSVRRDLRSQSASDTCKCYLGKLVKNNNHHKTYNKKNKKDGQ